MRRALRVLLLLPLYACTDSGTTPPREDFPARVEAASPTTLSGSVGETLEQPLKVRVYDSRNRPLGGVTVQWTVTAGGGQLGITSNVTDSLGLAQAEWTLGTTLASNAVTATVGSLTVVRFDATPTPGSVANLQVVSGDSQSVEAGQPLAQPFVVRTLDRFGNPTPGIAVQWSASFPFEGGTRSSASNESGEASILWSSGTKAGTVAVAARAGSEVALFTFTRRPGKAVKVASSWYVTAAPAGEPLPDSLVAMPLDVYFNPVPGVAVQFQVVAGGGSIDPATVVSDDQGFAKAVWTLGPQPGAPQEATATAHGLPTMAEWKADATEPGPDASPPKLESFSLARDTIDARLRSDTLRVRLRASDYQSGLAFQVAVIVRGPNRTELTAKEVASSYVNFSHHYRDYELRVPVPRGVEPGQWFVYYLGITDNAGNVLRLFHTDLRSRGYETDFVVLSQ